MIQAVPDDVPAEILLQDVQSEIVNLLRQQAQLKLQAQVARSLGDGEDQVAPLRRALERNLKVLLAYRKRERDLIGALQHEDNHRGAPEVIPAER